MRPGSGTREGSPQKLGEETKRGARIKAEPTQRLKARDRRERGEGTSRHRGGPSLGAAGACRAPTRHTRLIGFFPSKGRAGAREGRWGQRNAQCSTRSIEIT